MTSAVSQGLIKEPFNFKFVPFPRAGVKKVPTYYTSSVIVVAKTGKKIDEYAAELAKAIVSVPVHDSFVRLGNLPTRKDATAKPTDARLLEVAAILKEHGIQDVGLTDRRFTARRAQQFPILQKVLTFKLTPDEAIKLYQQKLTETK